MAKIVTILYDSRADAETARERLARNPNAKPARILGKDTLAALDGLEIDPQQASSLRQALRGGGHVVVAEVPSGTSPEHLLSLLGLSPRAAEHRESAAIQPLRHGIEKPGTRRTGDDAQRKQPVNEPLERPRQRSEAVQAPEPLLPVASRDDANPRRPDTPPGTFLCLSEEEAAAAGLFKERTIDFAEMREEAVITKEAFVREELIVKKTVKERTETIRDTVRNTKFDIERVEHR